MASEPEMTPAEIAETLARIPKARCAACRAGLSEPSDCVECLSGEIIADRAEIARLRLALAEAREVVRPFADGKTTMSFGRVLVGVTHADMARARDWLTRTEGDAHDR